MVGVDGTVRQRTLECYKQNSIGHSGGKQDDQNTNRNVDSDTRLMKYQRNKASIGNFVRIHLIWYYKNRKGALPLKHNPSKAPVCKCVNFFKNSFQRQVLEKTEHPKYYA